MNTPKIEMLPLSSLTAYDRNSRTHSADQVKQVAASIREFGFTNPILIDAAGEIIAGHGRVMAAESLGMEVVPCIRLAHLSETQKRAYVLADNQLALNAGWDIELLRVELLDLQKLDFSLDLLGFASDDLSNWLNELEETEGLTDPDDVPDPPVEAVTCRGDVWLMGRNRLMCGDSTSITTAETVLSGVTPDLCFYDPPYDMPSAWGYSYPANRIAALHDYKSVTGAIQALQGKPHVYQFIWDCGACWWTPNRPLARHKACLIGMDSPEWRVDAATVVDGKKRKAKTVKNTRGSCDYKPLSGGRVRMSTVFMSPTAQENNGHQHSKPVAWVKALIAGTGAGSVLDQFAGSGTGLIACEQLGIPCFSVELSELQCDVIVKRWEAFTGKKAELQK